MLNTKKKRSSPYHPQYDGQDERMNRIIMKVLALNVESPTKNLDLKLSLILMDYRSSFQASTLKRLTLCCLDSR